MHMAGVLTTENTMERKALVNEMGERRGKEERRKLQAAWVLRNATEESMQFPAKSPRMVSFRKHPYALGCPSHLDRSFVRALFYSQAGFPRPQENQQLAVGMSHPGCRVLWNLQTPTASDHVYSPRPCDCKIHERV